MYQIIKFYSLSVKFQWIYIIHSSFQTAESPNHFSAEQTLLRQQKTTAYNYFVHSIVLLCHSISSFMSSSLSYCARVSMAVFLFQLRILQGEIGVEEIVQERTRTVSECMHRCARSRGFFWCWWPFTPVKSDGCFLLAPMSDIIHLVDNGWDVAAPTHSVTKLLTSSWKPKESMF